jgi:hypothetical protein
MKSSYKWAIAAILLAVVAILSEPAIGKSWREALDILALAAAAIFNMRYGAEQVTKRIALQRADEIKRLRGALHGWLREMHESADAGNRRATREAWSNALCFQESLRILGVQEDMVPSGTPAVKAKPTEAADA